MHAKYTHIQIGKFDIFSIVHFDFQQRRFFAIALNACARRGMKGKTNNNKPQPTV